MSTNAQAKNFGYSEFNQGQTTAPESTRFTSPLNQTDTYHIGNDSSLVHDTFIWSVEEHPALVIPTTAAVGATSLAATTVLPVDLSNMMQNDAPTLLTQYFENTLGDSIIAPASYVAPIETPPMSQGDIDSLIGGNSIIPE